jgi:hypothetical protein
MQYMLMLFDDEARWDAMSEDEATRTIGAYAAYTSALREAGVYAGGDRLGPSTAATTVKVGSDGKTSVLDGPYPETKEQLGGYYLIDVPDMDAALTWAARCPCASHGTVEVRPLMVMVPAPV